MMYLRAYEASDWTAICQIHDRARPDELRGSCDPRAFIPIEQDPEVEDLRQASKQVAVEAGQVLGFAGVSGNSLDWLYVDPDSYGRGIGRKLLQWAVKEAGPSVWAIVLAGNERALKLYESEGFQEVNRFESENAGYHCTCLRIEK